MSSYSYVSGDYKNPGFGMLAELILSQLSVFYKKLFAFSKYYFSRKAKTRFSIVPFV